MRRDIAALEDNFTRGARPSEKLSGRGGSRGASRARAAGTANRRLRFRRGWNAGQQDAEALRHRWMREDGIA